MFSDATLEQRRLPLEFMDGLNFTTIIEPTKPPARRRGSVLDRQTSPRTMKFVPVFILFGLLLAGCKSPDTKLSRQLLGTWKRPAGNIPIASDSGVIFWKPEPAGSLTLLSNGRFTSSWENCRGTWHVKDGIMYLTVTNEASDETFALIGQKGVAKIVFINAHQLIYDTPEGEQVTLSR